MMRSDISLPGNLYSKKINLMIMTLLARDINLIHEAAALLALHLKPGLTISELAKLIELPEKKLKAGFKAEYNIGVYGYLKNIRIEKAKQLLKAGSSVKMTTREVGYKNESAFVKSFRQCVGITPAAWMRENTTSLHVAY
jgi:AraC family transcriptional activator of pyochelin receptor